MSNSSQSMGLLTEINQHLSGIFRHMLPGILVLAGAYLAYPGWFTVDLKSWQHLFVLGAISIAVGNAWYSLNRYGLIQLMDYGFYWVRVNGPSRGNTRFSYLDDLGQHTYKSLHLPSTSMRACQHLAFRVSTMLLLITIGELLWIFSAFHAQHTLFDEHKCLMRIGGTLTLAIGIWQTIIIRRIDYYIVNPPAQISSSTPGQ